MKTPQSRIATILAVAVVAVRRVARWKSAIALSSLALAFSALSACAGSGSDAPAPTSPPYPDAISNTPTATTAPSPTSTLTSNANDIGNPIPPNRAFDQPLEMFPWPSGGLAVLEREGYIEVYESASAEPRVALDMRERTSCCQGERGMLSAALDPRFDEFPFIYIYYQTEGEFSESGGAAGRLSRFPVSADGSVDAAGELVMLELRQSLPFHLGGAVRFGQDGMLYLGLGDKADAGSMLRAWIGAPDPQDLATLAGKIIRLDIRGATESRPYRIPSDNPFADAPGARPEIWAYGARNPWRMSFAPNGDLIVADVGANAVEEVSIAGRGANLGWPAFEGSERRRGDDEGEALADATFPIVEYPRSGGECGIIGGANLPGPDGGYVFGDLCSGKVWTLEGDSESGMSMRLIMDLPRTILAFGTDARGNLYALTRGGPIARVEDEE